ncbi:hypothetical protein H6B33_11265 [Gemmiger formicilis]|uniref:DUF6903 family protein n=1 Tax=Gemmiger formicilis TaxID=745368 RepID=UPI00195BCF20|nr:hypothetical protein [Gemmiger formicilis]MBM6915976.1 hypothetical protein [Gemmiger formicilis]
MDEYKKKTLKTVIRLVLLFACIGLVIAGHSMGFMGDLRQSITSLLVELLGLAGILVLLYLYNKPFTK